MDNYLKEMKFKCACPLCKKPLNRRELGEDPKIKTLADMMRRILAESTKINVGIQRTDLKKRKLDDYIKNSEGKLYLFEDFEYFSAVILICWNRRNI